MCVTPNLQRQSPLVAAATAGHPKSGKLCSLGGVDRTLALHSYSWWYHYKYQGPKKICVYYELLKRSFLDVPKQEYYTSSRFFRE